MTSVIWGKIGELTRTTLRNCGELGVSGDYLVQGTDAQAGPAALYGLSVNELNSCDARLRRRGLRLSPDNRGLVVVKLAP